MDVKPDLDDTEKYTKRDAEDAKGRAKSLTIFPPPPGEGTPLLGATSVKEENADAEFGGGVLCESRRLWAISFPMVLSSISGYIMSLSSLVILGTFAGPNDLAAASLGTTYSNVCGCSLLVGLSEAIDTLCSQAFGAKQMKCMGMILQRGVLILFLASTCAALLFYFTGEVLVALGQDPHLAYNSAVYVKYQIPGLYGYAMCMALQRYLSAQGIARPLFWVSAAALPVHVLLTFLLVHKFRLGKRGAAIGWSASFLLRAIALIAYTMWLEETRPQQERTWRGLNLRRAFKGWGELLAVSLPAYAMLATEWWAFEFLTLMSGLLPNPETQVIAQTICSNIIGFMFMFHLGLSVAVCVRVGNALGALRTDCTRRTIISSIGISLIQWAVVGGTFLLPIVRDNLSLLFAPASSGTPEQSGKVQALVRECLVYVVIQQFFDGLKEVFNGVIRGCGRQTVGMVTSFVSYFCLCLPLGYCLAFHKGQRLAPGIPGLFIATIIASGVHAALNCGVILTTDWKELAARCSGLGFMQRQHSTKSSLFDGPVDKNFSDLGSTQKLGGASSFRSNASSRTITPTASARGSPMMFASMVIPPPDLGRRLLSHTSTQLSLLGPDDELGDQTDQ
mmetsp:Transcript_9935/g.13828  ORF Transcript_9935/g.13828 Transcript_9935/m.13828 type:complete len:620 (-) Transcript_9935:92-1951(-)